MSDFNAEHFDPFAAQADEDEHAAHSGPEETDPFATDEPEAAEGDKELTPEEVTASLRLFLLQAVINDAVADYTKSRRTNIDELVHQAAKRFSTGQFAVNVETIDGAEELLAKITPKKTKESTKLRDEQAFIAWLKANAPEEVETEHVEEKTITVEAHDVDTIKDGALDRIVAKAKATDDGTLMTTDGVPIDGLTHTPEGKPSGTVITWGGTGSPTKKRALQRLLNGEIAGTSVGQIIARTQGQIEKGK